MSAPSLMQALGFATALFLCGFWLLPGGVLALRRRAKGEIQVDVRLFYGTSTLYRLLKLYGEGGRASFRRMLLVDMVFPAVYGGLLFALASSAPAFHPAMSEVARTAQIMAISAALWDYAENVLLLVVLNRFPTLLPFTASCASFCTSAKMVCFIVALVALGLLYLG